jgi:hypothetical protein
LGESDSIVVPENLDRRDGPRAAERDIIERLAVAIEH